MRNPEITKNVRTPASPSHCSLGITGTTPVPGMCAQNTSPIEIARNPSSVAILPGDSFGTFVAVYSARMSACTWFEVKGLRSRGSFGAGCAHRSGCPGWFPRSDPVYDRKGDARPGVVTTEVTMLFRGTFRRGPVCPDY